MHTLQKIILSLIALMAIMFGQFPFWIDPDIVIDSARDYQAISVATRRSNGEIFVAVSGRFFEDPTRYGIKVFRSLDGMNWSQYLWWSISQGNVFNPSMAVFTAQDSEFLYVAFENWDTVANERNIRAYRRNLALSSGLYRDISIISGVAEKDPSLCTSNPAHLNSPWLFCAFVSGDSIAFIRSANYGLTWTDRQIICPGSATADYLNPSCAFGWFSTPPESMSVGVAWQYLDTTATVREIRFRKNTLNGMPGFWRPTINFTSPANCYDNFPCLQMTHGGYPSAVITFVRKDTLGTDKAHLYYFCSTSGGNTWSSRQIYTSSYATNVPQHLVVDDTLGYYHVAFRDQDGSMMYQKARYDSISSPWSSPVCFSSGNNWSDWDLPAVGVRNGEPYVAWVDHHSPVYKLKFDADWLQTTIRENKSASLPNPVVVSPNPAKGTFTLHYQVNNPGKVKIALYDASGGLIRNVLECDMSVGQHQTKIETKTLAAGVYFIKIDTPKQTWREWIVVLK